jgi:hypothetical protein
MTSDMRCVLEVFYPTSNILHLHMRKHEFCAHIMEELIKIM